MINKRFTEKAFAVRFKDLWRWDPPSFLQISWHWPSEVMKPLGSALEKRAEKVDRNKYAFSDLQPITIHFDGTLEKREIEEGQEYKMDLWFARPGDIVISKIDLKNGAVGIIPENWHNVVVTGHFTVYKPDTSQLSPEYLLRIIQAKFFKSHLWRNKVGAEGRKEVKMKFFEAQNIPLPPLSVQHAIIDRWNKGLTNRENAKLKMRILIEELNTHMLKIYHSTCKKNTLLDRYVVIPWKELSQWGVQGAHADAFRISNPNFVPLGSFAEEVTQLVYPFEEPDKEWPVYGVNNIDGVFFSHFQKGCDFKSAYKMIKKNWFFHNPTRANVGSLGIVGEVSIDAITSPEYQVWRIREGLIPGFVALLISTQFFLKLIQFHRVGGVKQRLYVNNLLEIPIPIITIEEQKRFAESRERALEEIMATNKNAIEISKEVDELLLGSRKLPIK